MSKKPNEMTIVEAARALRLPAHAGQAGARELTVRELWDACAEAAHAKNPELNAFLEIFDIDERAIEAAQIRIDTEKDAAPLLCGIPLAIKDNILIGEDCGVPRARCSRIIQRPMTPRLLKS